MPILLPIPDSLLTNPDAPSSVKLLYGYIGALAEGNRLDVGLTVAELASDIGIGERTAHRALRWLQQHRYMTIQRVYAGHGAPSSYRLLR